MSQRSVDLGGVLHLVDVVQLESLVDGGWETGPDDIVRVDRGDEEGRLGGLDVVGEVAVGQVAAGEVVEVATLTMKSGEVSTSHVLSSLYRAVSFIPEGLGRVIVLEKFGHAALEIENAVGLGVLLADLVDDATGVRLARVLALEHGFEIFGDHLCVESMRRVREAARSV